MGLYGFVANVRSKQRRYLVQNAGSVLLSCLVSPAMVLSTSQEDWCSGSVRHVTLRRVRGALHAQSQYLATLCTSALWARLAQVKFCCAKCVRSSVVTHLVLLVGPANGRGNATGASLCHHKKV